MLPALANNGGMTSNTSPLTVSDWYKNMLVQKGCLVDCFLFGSERWAGCSKVAGTCAIHLYYATEL